MDINSLVKLAPNPNVAAVVPGDTVKVMVKVIEGEKTRSQMFQGVVIRVRRGTNGASFTVRRVTHGTGVERTFMVHSPLLEEVEVVRHGDVRRARLYYLRGLSTKEARFKERGRAVEAGEVLETAVVSAEADASGAAEAEPAATKAEVVVPEKVKAGPSISK
jgi:large subunit ribosomal protein L19